MDTNPNKYWFKRRRYGYGWAPATWQGLLVTLLYLVVVVGAALAFTDAPEATQGKEVGLFLLILVLATGGLIGIGIRKGPKPRWRWGKKQTDNPEEDF